jgi:hypothetical protein
MTTDRLDDTVVRDDESFKVRCPARASAEGEELRHANLREVEGPVSTEDRSDEGLDEQM